MKKVVVVGKGVLTGCVVFLFLLAAWKFCGAQTIELKLSHFMSPLHIQHQKGFAPFAEKVEKLTGGKVKIKIFPGGTLGGPTQLPDMVKTGVTDIAFIIPSYTTGRFPRSSVFDLPFLFEDAIDTAKTVYDVYDKYLAPDYKDYEVLWLYSSGAGQLYSVAKPINTLQDLKGMKMRGPSAYMSEALKLLGANPVGLPISELAVSLEKKIIDGMLTPYSAAEDFKLYDLVSYVTEVNLYTTQMAVVMNKEKYNSLPDFAKKALHEASGKPWGLHTAEVYDEHDVNTVKKMKDTGKIKIIKISDSEKRKFTDPVLVMHIDWVNRMSKQGLPAKEILDAVKRSAAKKRQ